MKKIIQRTKRFEKAYGKLQKATKKIFIKKLEYFLNNEFHPTLDTHQLKGKRKNHWSFSVTSDVRAIYQKKEYKGKTVLIFSFINIGSHNKVY